MREFKSLRSQEAQAALVTGYCALQTVLLVVDNPEAFDHAFAAFYAAYDSYLSIINAEMKPTCRNGCASCCFDNPHGVSGAELHYINRLIEQDSRYEGIRSKVALRRKEFELVAAQSSADPVQIRWKRQKRSCVFLDEEKRCGIYERRPVACRMFFSLTPREQCHPDHPLNAEAVNPHLEPSTAIKDFLKQISKVLGLSGLPTDFVSGLDSLMQRSL